MANSALLSRTPSNPLLRLNLKINSPLPCDLTNSFICSLLDHAHALGLRHLTIDDYWDFENSESVLRSVFSISSLESLSISVDSTFPSKIAFTRLRSLSINFTTVSLTQVQRLLSELCCLEDLKLSVSDCIKNVCLSCQTIKKLELFFDCIDIDSLGLSMPSLEFISLVCVCHYGCRNIPLIHGEIPFIRKAVVTINSLRQKHTIAVVQLLNFIAHAEELSLDLEEDWPQYAVERGQRNAWRSKLPRNRDGNYQYACFKNLHLGENREEFKKLLNKKCTPKKQRVGS